ncbi:MAG: hypothetical protein COB51_02260 [Moraxellaceae bacterium]|nr:MAG: hypothetical protein COB51_02260 [Moraxellaceae bacterium]
MSEERILGIVKWFDNSKGFGFIQRPGEDDVFVHYRAIRGEGYRTLKDGQTVDFQIIEGPKGFSAEDVGVIEGAPAPALAAPVI